MGRMRMRRKLERSTTHLILKKKPRGRRIRIENTGRKRVRKRMLRNGSSRDRQMLVGARRLGGRKGKNRQRNQRVRVIQRMKERREKREGNSQTLRRRQEQKR